MVKRIIGLLGIILVTAGIGTAEAQEYTWQTLLQETKKSNPEIRKTLHALEQARLSYRSAYAGFLPAVSASAQTSQSDRQGSDSSKDYSYGVRGSLSLFSGFSDYYNVKSKNTALRMAELQLQRTIADVVHALRRSYINLLWAQETVQRIRGLGRRADVVLADLSDLASHEPLVTQAWEWNGSVEIWVNNAGADVLTGAAADWPFERMLDYLWSVDVRGTISLSRQIGERMRAAGPAELLRTILNVGWDQAERGMGGDSGEMFAATKGAVMAFTRSLALSLAPIVRVNAVAPGWIRTAWGDSASRTWQERVLRETPLARWGTPEDVAHLARYLVSPASAFLTGQILRINGGAIR